MANDTGTHEDAQIDKPEKSADWMTKIAEQLGLQNHEKRGAPPKMSPGDRAALRRMDTTRARMADGATIKLLTAAKVPTHRQTRDFGRWRLIAHVAAMLSGTGKLRAHAANRSFGRILKEAGYSETRLMRLLSVHGEALDDQVRRAIRIIDQKSKQPIDLWEVYHLLSTNPERAEVARIQIAQDYFAAADAADKGDVE